MNKKLTGREFGQREYKKLGKCVECGIASTKPYGAKCDLCISLDLKKCEMCEIVLREGAYRFYTYDINEEFTQGYIGFGKDRRLVREFTYVKESEYPKATDCLCTGCVGWESKMKDDCYNCNCWFNNTKEHYKNHGNLCPDCARSF